MSDRLISREEAAAMIFPFDVAGIRAEFVRMLQNRDSAEFIRELLERAAENGRPNNPLVARDLLEIFDLIQSQRGFIRAGDTARGARIEPGFSNFALGSIATGDAAIQIGVRIPGAPVMLSQLTRDYLKSDARTALHETLHHAGRLLYSDQDYAVVVSAMTNNNPPLPVPGDRAAFSRYWDAELRRRCRI